MNADNIASLRRIYLALYNPELKAPIKHLHNFYNFKVARARRSTHAATSHKKPQRQQSAQRTANPQ